MENSEDAQKYHSEVRIKNVLVNILVHYIFGQPLIDHLERIYEGVLFREQKIYSGLITEGMLSVYQKENNIWVICKQHLMFMCCCLSF